MKVLHLIQRPQLRGAEIFASQLAGHINKNGHSALIVSVFDGNAELPFKDKLHSLKGNPNRRFFDVNAWRKLADIIRVHKPDIIQANAGDTLKYAVFSKLIHRWKQPIVFRNASTISLYIKSWFARKLNALFFSFTDKIISVSKTSARDFGKVFPEYRNKIVTIPVGIEPMNMLAGPLKTNGRQYHPDHRKILHVGGFTYEKNHQGLISIFEKVLKTKPHATLHLVGDGPLKSRIQELVKEKKLEESVLFHGYQNNPLDHIRKANVLVLPSIIEGLPGVILEAFYCKTPVVAFDVGGIKEIVTPDTGRLVEEGNEEDFAEAIIDTLDNPEYNRQVTETAHSMVVNQFMNADIARKFLNVYESLLT